ncbi:MAG: DUF58 domain-containing protein [Mogibacterium sp.]|nr:DUF58 domain-containing protein [Mogibacterium sp.]
MIKRRIACILLILSAILLYFFANETVTLALLLALIAMPLASVGMLALSGKKLRLSLTDSEVLSEKPVMKLSLKNESIIPVALAELEITCENLRTGETDSDIIQTSLGIKGRKEMDFEMQSGHAGMYRVSVTNAVVMDPLMLLSKSVSCDDSRFITVMPELFDVQMSYGSDAALLENDRSADSRRGEDPGDVRGIREYVPGDPVRNIHWKLSEKTNKVLVKELGAPITDQFLLILGNASERSSDPEALEAIASVFASLVETLRQDNVSLTIAWSDAMTGRAVVRKIQDEEELRLATEEYLAAPAAAQGAFANIDRNIADARYAHVVIVCGKIPAGLEAIANGCSVTVLLNGTSGITTENNVKVIGFENDTYREDLAGMVV